MTFGQRLRNAMNGAEITLKDLSLKTGIGKSSISQYLSGKNKPNQNYITILANALHADEAWLLGEVEEPEEFPGKIRIIDAARCMHKSTRFVMDGMISGALPIGAAIKYRDSPKYSYYVSPEKFRAYVGAETFNKFFGLEKKDEKE